MKKIYYFIFGMILFVPLGLLTSNPAWGEWEESYYEEVLGYVPQGIKESLSINAPIPDYSLGFTSDIGSYYLSAFIGVCVIFGIFFLLKQVVHSAR